MHRTASPPALALVVCTALLLLASGGRMTATTGQSVVARSTQAPASPAPACGGRSANPRTPCAEHVAAMLAALPETAPARPTRPRKVLVLARAAGYVHSSIPLAVRTVEELGLRTGAWATTATYDAADVTTENLKQYDAIFLASTTGHFLDDPDDAAATAARRAALLAFVRGGKGLAAIHAATDSYHASATAEGSAPRPKTDQWPDDQVGTWPEFNTLLGGFFKYHWNDGQSITYVVEEPDHPLNAPFRGHTPFVVEDETYTFGREVYSRDNLRVLTSVDYARMSAEDRAKEQFPRPDHDHPLSWVRGERKGRVFYMSHGHNEKVYANRVLLAHLLRGIQYALGDIAADDSPRAR